MLSGLIKTKLFEGDNEGTLVKTKHVNRDKTGQQKNVLHTNIFSYKSNVQFYRQNENIKNKNILKSKAVLQFVLY